jgi:hypothetical protein
LIKKHLKNLVRVTDINELGDEMTTWRSIGEDHFLFATFYAWLAAEMLEDATKGVVLPSGHGLMAKTRMKG